MVIISFAKKNNKCLAKKFLNKNLQNSNLNTVLKPTEKRFAREIFLLCDCYICCLDVFSSNVFFLRFELTADNTIVEMIEILLFSDREAK